MYNSFRIDELPEVSYLMTNTGFQVISSEIIAQGLKDGVHSCTFIVSPVDPSKPCRHEIIDFMISGQGEVWIK